MKLFHLLYLFALLFVLSSCKTPNADQKEYQDEEIPIAIDVPTHLFVGTYTRNEGWVNGSGEGIYRLSVGGSSELTIDETAANVINPTFIALSPDQKNLYSVSELFRGDEPTGFVHAFTVNEDLSLTFIAKYPTNAQSPAHVSVDATGKFVFVANYQGGVAMVYTRNEDGSLQFAQQLDHSGSGPHRNQNASHVHMVKVSPDNNFLYVPDLGTDKIWSYNIDHESGSVSKTEQEFGSTAPGAGPRHMDFHPALDIAYVINELNSTISVFDYDPETGSLTEKQVVPTLPDSFNEWNSTADIHVHPNGKFLYGSNRGHNSIASYSINESTGELTFIERTSTEGEIPRNFAISPVGDVLYAANQDSRNITIFNVDQETGTLSFTGNSLSIGTPVCIIFFTAD